MAVTLRKYLNNQLKSKGLTAAKAKKNADKYKSIAAAKKAGSLYYTNKDGKVMAAVYAEDLKKPIKEVKSNKKTLKSSLRPKLRPPSVKRVTKAPDKSTPSVRLRKTTTKDLNKIANIASKAIDNDPGVMTQAEKLERKLANLENKVAKAKLGGGTVPNSVKTEIRSLQRSLAKLTPRLSDDIKVGLLSGIDSIKVLIAPGRLFPKKKPKKKGKK
tara:strand:- start:78 stop:722 length:645 start_codon:yes stop_codon:yes gene_type:complete